MNIFEIAVRNKFRFPLKGMLSVEDLFDLSLNDLDSIFKTLNGQLKKVSEESLLAVKTKEDEEIQIKIAIIKYIVSVKQEAQDKAKAQLENKQQRELIKQIMAEKQNAELKNKSAKELQEMYNSLKD